MVYLFKVIYLIFLIEALLRTLYFWQLKEYRADRFWEFLNSGEAGRYFLPGRHFLRPKLTVKIVLLFFISLVFARQLVWWLGYLLVPAIVALSVGAVSPWSGLAKWLIVLAAKIKLGFYRQNLIVIGITGSFGKSSTKEILAHLLAAKYKVLKTAANNNTLIGIAKTILTKLNKDRQVFVVEMGAYKRGEIGEICRLVRPDIGILTGINEQHAGLFGSLENTIKAKSELIAALPQKGLAVINADNANSRTVAKKPWPAAVRTYRRPQRPYATNLVGRHQQLNISAAVTVANHLGVPKKEIEAKLKNIPAINSALRRTQGVNGAIVVLDTYSSNRDGFLAAIDFCAGSKARLKILVTPGISELGRSSESVHRAVAKKAASVFDRIYVTKTDAKRWFKDAEFIAENRLPAELKAALRKSDLVLLEGRLSSKLVKELCRR